MQTISGPARQRCVGIRQLRPGDVDALAAFERSLSAETVYRRYFGFPDIALRIARDRAEATATAETGGDLVLVAEVAGEIVGLGLLCRPSRETRAEAEVALVVRDAFQGQGIGTALLNALFERATAMGVASVVAFFLHSNLAMRRLCEAAGMVVQDRYGSCEAKATLKLQGPSHRE